MSSSSAIMDNEMFLVALLVLSSSCFVLIILILLAIFVQKVRRNVKNANCRGCSHPAGERLPLAFKENKAFERMAVHRKGSTESVVIVPSRRESPKEHQVLEQHTGVLTLGARGTIWYPEK